jgi:hypothetical protein
VLPRPARRFGTAGPIANLFREVWKEELHVFAAEGLTQEPATLTKELGHPDRTSSETLNLHPVDVLAIEETSTSRGETERYWARWLDACTEPNLPAHIIVSAATSELVKAGGLQSKMWQRRYTRWGYSSAFWFIRGARARGGS